MTGLRRRRAIALGSAAFAAAAIIVAAVPVAADDKSLDPCEAPACGEQPQTCPSPVQKQFSQSGKVKQITIADDNSVALCIQTDQRDFLFHVAGNIPSPLLATYLMLLAKANAGGLPLIVYYAHQDEVTTLSTVKGLSVGVKTAAAPALASLRHGTTDVPPFSFPGAKIVTVYLVGGTDLGGPAYATYFGTNPTQAYPDGLSLMVDPTGLEPARDGTITDPAIIAAKYLAMSSLAISALNSDLQLDLSVRPNPTGVWHANGVVLSGGHPLQ